MKHSTTFAFAVALTAALAATGCTTVSLTHPAVTTGLQPAATVYFIRERERMFGWGVDNRVEVAVDGRRLLKIGRGKYAALRLAPGEHEVVATTHNTRLVGRREISYDATESARVTFHPDAAHAVVLRRISRRGAGHRSYPAAAHAPVELSIEEARSIAADLAPRIVAAVEPLY